MSFLGHGLAHWLWTVVYFKSIIMMIIITTTISGVGLIVIIIILFLLVFPSCSADNLPEYYRVSCFPAFLSPLITAWCQGIIKRASSGTQGILLT
ncbi:hypothetical protein C8Q69DRAFT_461793, partial [Paecilomyces variotii]